MGLTIDIITLMYLCSGLLLAVYATGTLLLLMAWWWKRHDTPSLPVVDERDLPTVLVQLPVYNEHAVIGRLIDAVAGLDYPQGKLSIQVLDDSTDDTSDAIRHRVAYHARNGLSIAHVQRSDRNDYKSGALAHGLQGATADLVAVFDADFVPEHDFLRQVVPHFCSNDSLGMVQTRWAHLNADENILTRAQALSLDGHFIVEQTARSRSGLLLNFSGSGGVWRIECVRDAGDWSFMTLAEDLDLSYRAQLRGWRLLYLPDVAVPAEIPPQLAAYKQQQARWAKGSTQNLILHGSALWKNREFGLSQKVMGTLHLGQYLTHPLMLILLLLSPPLLITGSLENLPLTPLGIAGVIPPVLYMLSQRHLHADWPHRLLGFPILLGIGTGLALNNSLAIIDALRKQPNVFRRTPKFRGESWKQSRYALRIDWTIVGEAFLALYAIAAGVLALKQAPSLVPFLFLYAYAFSMVVAWSLLEGVQLRRTRTRKPPVREQVSI
jgi:cellulose synthase/poly-beta-1,6-N-acetylglucosamine synthase-like glycosyltransferase